MLYVLAMAFQVVRRPNSAFATLRDNDHLYFQSSIMVMLSISIVYTGLGLVMPELAGQHTVHVANSGLAILGGVTTVGTIYLIGRALGGNKNWRKVFTVLFYVEIIYIPVQIVSLLLSLTSSPMLSTTSYSQSLGLLTMVGPVALGLFIWAIVIGVKAIKVLNGFGTAKAFGILLLSGIIRIWITS